ncbi:MAG: TIGR03790 family protein [Sulfuritalea sp.]|nr:TIGR03790 family protein [Sulfuritalea sp.]
MRFNSPHRRKAWTSPLPWLRLLVLVAVLAAPLVHALPRVQLQQTGFRPDQVAILINEDDPLSRQIGEYYRQARQIPEGNLIRLRFPPGRAALAKDEFLPLKAQIDRATPAHVQAYAVAWTMPYRVACMSLTSALALGFAEEYCSDKCGPTAASTYFNSTSRQPAADFKLRPAMMLAGADFNQVKALIDRGIAADSSFPEGRAYLLNTPDKARSVRSAYFEQAAKEFAGVFPVDVLEAGSIEDRRDVLFYFTGLPFVPQLKTLGFLPGALADHLTSFGGQLSGSSQMSSLRWLEAGATASYGTVVEPCNHPQKFPFPAVAMFYYFQGASAIEAYWKSLAWPGEGVFVGEPLAAPFAPLLRETRPGQFELRVFSPREGRVRFAGSGTPIGPFKVLPQTLRLQRGANLLRFKVPETGPAFVRLLW